VLFRSWGQQYSRKVSDIFALQGDLAKEMTAALRMRLTGKDEKRMAKTYTANPEAYQDYLRGRLWLNRRNEEAFHKATDYFQQAIHEDPAYALAYSGLADSQSLLAVFGVVAPKEAFPRAKEAALKALELDDTIAEAHASLGIIKEYYDWDWSGADREFQRAIAINAGYTEAYNFYGAALWQMGRMQDSIAEKKKAVEVDPLALTSNTFLGSAFWLARQYDQAIEQYRKALELDPNFTFAHSFLGLAYVEKSMSTEAMTEFEKALAISPGDAMATSGLGYAYAVAGRTGEAQKVLDRLSDLSKQKYVPAWSRAVIYLGLGEKDKAFEWLEKAYQERSTATGLCVLKVSPLFDPLRSDPRFADLLRRMNLTP